MAESNRKFGRKYEYCMLYDLYPYGIEPSGARIVVLYGKKGWKSCYCVLKKYYTESNRSGQLMSSYIEKRIEMVVLYAVKIVFVSYECRLPCHSV